MHVKSQFLTPKSQKLLKHKNLSEPELAFGFEILGEVVLFGSFLKIVFMKQSKLGKAVKCQRRVENGNL